MRYLSAGESHGPCLTGIIEGLPAGLPISSEMINKQLARRQTGYGRGGRMFIERDRVEFFSGVRHGKTLGSPVTMVIRNKDWENWRNIMSPEGEETFERLVTAPRPGHADFSGGIKYRCSDLRNILERASARETAMRVAIGTIGRTMLEHFNMNVVGHVIAIGGEEAETTVCLSPAQIYACAEGSPVRCADSKAGERMVKAIEEARENGDSVGGVFEIIVCGVSHGLGSHVHWDRRLDGRIAGALMSLQGIKGVEVGAGFAAAKTLGSKFHDPFFYEQGKGVYRSTNRVGGLEGGITNGEDLIIRAAMKPIPTLYRALPSVDLAKKEAVRAVVERSDVCAVPAAAVVGEAIVAWEVAVAFMEKFAGDSMAEIEYSVDLYRQHINNYLC